MISIQSHDNNKLFGIWLLIWYFLILYSVLMLKDIKNGEMGLIAILGLIFNWWFYVITTRIK